MRQNFPLFRSHIDLAHHYWEKILKKEDWAIDATCGNGHDTLKLSEILLEKQGYIISIDLQQEAIDRTRKLLQLHLLQEHRKRIHLYCQSHTHFPSLAQEHPIRLIVYNLGYLPRADKQITTLTCSTLESVKQAMTLIIPGGVICITCYPGHKEGKEEEIMLLNLFSHLPSNIWNVCYHTFPNRSLSPSLFLIQKNEGHASPQTLKDSS